MVRWQFLNHILIKQYQFSFCSKKWGNSHYCSFGHIIFQPLIFVRFIILLMIPRLIILNCVPNYNLKYQNCLALMRAQIYSLLIILYFISNYFSFVFIDIYSTIALILSLIFFPKDTGGCSIPWVTAFLRMCLCHFYTLIVVIFLGLVICH